MQTSLGQLGATPEMHSTQTPAAVNTTPASSRHAVATLTSTTLEMSLTGVLPAETLPLQVLSHVIQNLERASEGVRPPDLVTPKTSLPPGRSTARLKASTAAAWGPTQRDPHLRVCPDHQAIFLLVSIAVLQNVPTAPLP